MKVFAKIRGRNQSSTSPDVVKQDNIIERNFNRMVLNPTKRVTNAQDTVNYLKKETKNFSRYLKEMRNHSIKEKKLIAKEYEESLKQRRQTSNDGQGDSCCHNQGPGTSRSADDSMTQEQFSK